MNGKYAKTKFGKPRKRNAAGLAMGAMAALFVGLAGPASAAPSGPDYDAFEPTQTRADAHGWWKGSTQNPYGSYQNNTPRQSASKR